MNAMVQATSSTWRRRASRRRWRRSSASHKGGNPPPETRQGVILPDPVAAFLQAAGADLARPHVCESPEGEIVLEWWADCGPHKVTVYFEHGVVTCCIRSWGWRIESEMEAVESLTPAELREALTWMDI